MVDKTKALFFGKGILNWRAVERISDRYGTINLGTEIPIAYNYIGYRGKLYAEVKGTRPIGHIGDLLRGFKPSVPEIGEVFLLGSGELFMEDRTDDGVTYTNIGVKPDDNRTSDWLDPDKLYCVHNQFVTLWFEPENM